MEEFKGTPGPWSFDETFNVYEGDRDGHICTVTSWLDESTADANGFFCLQHLLTCYPHSSNYWKSTTTTPAKSGQHQASVALWIMRVMRLIRLWEKQNDMDSIYHCCVISRPSGNNC